MSFKKSDRVTYTDDNGVTIYAYIQEADAAHDLYFLHENIKPVSASRLELNTAPDFTIPNTREEYMQFHKDYLIDHYAAFLKQNSKDPGMYICRELHMIYLKLTEEIEDPSEEKEYIDQQLAQANRLIEELNTHATDTFQSEIPVIFKHQHRGIPLTSIWI